MITWHRYIYRAGLMEFRYVGEVLGNTEVWFGFELPFDQDMTELGLIRADKMTDDEAAAIGVTRWTQLDVPPPEDSDPELWRMLFTVASVIAKQDGDAESKVLPFRRHDEP